MRIRHLLEAPGGVNLLVGDSSKAQSVLGWSPAYTFTELVREMVLNDLETLSIGSPSQKVPAVVT